MREKVKEYIEFLNNKENVFYEVHEGKMVDGVMHLGGVSYSDKVNEFTKFIWNEEVMFKGEYRDWLDGNRKRTPREIHIMIDTADELTLRKMLTFYTRGERFCGGFMRMPINENYFSHIMKKLLDLGYFT